jgi:hypothetical protein
MEKDARNEVRLAIEWHTCAPINELTAHLRLGALPVDVEVLPRHVRSIAWTKGTKILPEGRNKPAKLAPRTKAIIER